ncbi:MAG: class I SAM-dependent methyltransferase [Myxococcota bacterium]|jgi:predicted O-methyltransferase YrrM|nr:class I SAM-dependent methyltransferase [Myxococcota bacterium]
MDDWRARLDAYLTELLPPPPAALGPFTEAMRQRFGTDWSVGPLAGWTLHALARLAGARRVLEIGTCLGASAAWLALAVRDRGGSVLSIEVEHERVLAARELLRQTGLDGVVTVIEGDAGAILPTLEGPFELIFQDGEKAAYLPLLEPCLQLLAPGGLLVADDGHFPLYPWSEADQSNAAAIREFSRALCQRPELLPWFIPVGDGLLVAQRRA